MDSNSFQIMNSNNFRLLNELFTKLSFIVKCIFALILVSFIFIQIYNTKNCVDMCARHGRGAVEICFSEKGALAKKRLGNTGLNSCVRNWFCWRGL